MVRKLIGWALNNPIVVFAYIAVVIGLGMYSYTHINVEAYPDPAPPIIELIAQNPGASAEEMERLVTIPLEIDLAGIPGCKTVVTKSLFELTHVRCIFEYGVPYYDAQQQVINRLTAACMTVPLPQGVQATLSPANPIAEIYRYVLKTPKNAMGEEVYTLQDIKALEDWLLEREWRRIPGVFDISSFGGMVKRYEIQPDPERMKRYGISLQTLSSALSNSNMNVSGDFLKFGSGFKTIICRGLIGGHKDPMEKAILMNTPEEAAEYLRAEERRRCSEIRRIVLTSINDKQILVDDVVDGGPLPFPDAASDKGVVVSNQTRLGIVSYDQCLDHDTGKWLRENEKVQGIVLMRKNQHTMPVLRRVKALADELNGIERVPRKWYNALTDWFTNERPEALKNFEMPGTVETSSVDLEGTSNGNTRITGLASTAKLARGTNVSGPRVPAHTYVVEVTDGQSVTLNKSVPADRLKLTFRTTRVSGLKSTEKLSTGMAVTGDDVPSGTCVLGVLGADSVTLNKELPAGKSTLTFTTRGRLLPGIELQSYYDREDLVDRTTHTVRENLFVGIALVVVILMMFLSNVRTCIIVAINMPLALLFSFSVLYFRGKSANLLSIGAVDFGIICDSTVIIVENIYRNMAAGQHADKPMKERILYAVREVDNALFFSTLIMVVAFMPLFTMQGAEGELFGPMAQTYAMALAGALFFAMTLTPVLCMYMFKGMKPREDNFLVRFLKGRYLWQLRLCLRYRFTTVAVMVTLMVITAVWPLQMIGREFMPELEEGNLWIRGVFPVNENLDAVAEGVKRFRDIVERTDYKVTDKTLKELPSARWNDDNKKPQRGVPAGVVAKLQPLKDENFEDAKAFLTAVKKKLDKDEFNRFHYPILKYSTWRAYPELEAVLVQQGRPDDGTDASLFNNAEIYVPFRKHKDWPEVTRPNGITMVRTRREITADLTEDLLKKSPGIDWSFSQYIRDNVNEGMTGVKGDNAVKIYGPDLAGLEDIAFKVKERLMAIRGVEDVGIYRVMGQANMEFAVDKKKCERWGLQVNDVATVVASLVHGYPSTQMVEGEKLFDITVRLPWARRRDEASILEARVDVFNRTMMPNDVPNNTPSYLAGATIGGPAARGTLTPNPNGGASLYLAPMNNFAPGLRLRDLVSPVDDMGRIMEPREVLLPNGQKVLEEGSLTRPGGSIIAREQGKRFIAVKFAVRDRDLASAVAEVERKTRELINPPYRVQFGGEFEQMQDAEARLMIIIPASLILICLFLYVAFRSIVDVLVILSNVFDVAIGGIWALYLTNTHFNVSSAVGFVSLFGVAIMEGLLMIGYFNDLRRHGLGVYDAITEGAAKRVRPVMITALTAIFGLLPGALSTEMGNQSAKPLAIVVVGGMAVTLFLDRYLMPVLYSFYGHREPPKDATSMAH